MALKRNPRKITSSITPTQAKLVNIKNQDGVTKILDMVPDFVNKFASRGKKDEAATEKLDEESKKAAESEMNEILSDAVNKDEE